MYFKQGSLTVRCNFLFPLAATSPFSRPLVVVVVVGSSLQVHHRGRRRRSSSVSSPLFFQPDLLVFSFLLFPSSLPAVISVTSQSLLYPRRHVSSRRLSLALALVFFLGRSHNNLSNSLLVRPPAFRQQRSVCFLLGP